MPAAAVIYYDRDDYSLLKYVTEMGAKKKNTGAIAGKSDGTESAEGALKRAERMLQAKLSALEAMRGYRSHPILTVLQCYSTQTKK